MLAQNYEMDADAWFLTGKVALEMDVYDEAASDFEQAYGEDSSYDRAIQIYETYLDKDMEAVDQASCKIDNRLQVLQRFSRYRRKRR